MQVCKTHHKKECTASYSYKGCKSIPYETCQQESVAVNIHTKNNSSIRKS